MQCAKDSPQSAAGEGFQQPPASSEKEERITAEASVADALPPDAGNAGVVGGGEWIPLQMENSASERKKEIALGLEEVVLDSASVPAVEWIPLQIEQEIRSVQHADAASVQEGRSPVEVVQSATLEPDDTTSEICLRPAEVLSIEEAVSTLGGSSASLSPTGGASSATGETRPNSAKSGPNSAKKADFVSAKSGPNSAKRARFVIAKSWPNSAESNTRSTSGMKKPDDWVSVPEDKMTSCTDLYFTIFGDYPQASFTRRQLSNLQVHLQGFVLMNGMKVPGLQDILSTLQDILNAPLCDSNNSDSNTSSDVDTDTSNTLYPCSNESDFALSHTDSEGTLSHSPAQTLVSAGLGSTLSWDDHTPSPSAILPLMGDQINPFPPSPASDDDHTPHFSDVGSEDDHTPLVSPLGHDHTPSLVTSGEDHTPSLSAIVSEDDHTPSLSPSVATPNIVFEDFTAMLEPVMPSSDTSDEGESSTSSLGVEYPAMVPSLLMKMGQDALEEAIEARFSRSSVRHMLLDSGASYLPPLYPYYGYCDYPMTPPLLPVAESMMHPHSVEVEACLTRSRASGGGGGSTSPPPTKSQYLLTVQAEAIWTQQGRKEREDQRP